MNVNNSYFLLYAISSIIITIIGSVLYNVVTGIALGIIWVAFSLYDEKRAQVREELFHKQLVELISKKE
jgi:MFS superfamily sulfate permease-like transporter